MSQKEREISREIELRPGEHGDLGFILQSWLRSFIPNGNFCRRIPRKIAYLEQERLIKSILGRAFVYIAFPKDGSRSQIIGYIVGEATPRGVFVAHYAYTKEAYRRLGVAEILLRFMMQDLNCSEKTFIASHITTEVAKNFKLPEMTYNPYVLLKGGTDFEPFGAGDISNKVG